MSYSLPIKHWDLQNNQSFFIPKAGGSFSAFSFSRFRKRFLNQILRLMIRMRGGSQTVMSSTPRRFHLLSN